jgi:hypothetical protein
MLISHIVGDCPHCHAKRAFGNVSVIGDRLLQGCPACGYDTEKLLPELRKKITTWTRTCSPWPTAATSP